jgi:hypothetical protein
MYQNLALVDLNVFRVFDIAAATCLLFWCIIYGDKIHCATGF